MDLVPGQRWDREIRNALKASDFILIFFSRNSVVRRGYIQREFKLALDILQEMPENLIHIIPARLDDCTIPDQFGFLHWCNLFEREGFQRLVQALHMGLSQRQQSESRAPTQERVEAASPLFPDQQIDSLSPREKVPVVAESPQHRKIETSQEEQMCQPSVHSGKATTFQEEDKHGTPYQHKMAEIWDRLKTKLILIQKYRFLWVPFSLLLLFILIFYLSQKRTDIVFLNQIPGVYLRTDVKSGEKITKSMVETWGDISHLQDGQPDRVEHVIGFCTVKALQKGARLMLDNIGGCTN
jgi:hypothetical protein